MTRELSILSSKVPTAIAATPDLYIAHVQLRDLVICPRERGLVNYVTRDSVVEQDLYNPRSKPRSLFNLPFSAANITSLPVLGGNATLFAAGGQEAELHLSLHHHSTRHRRTGAIEWKFEERLKASINNSILLTSLDLGKSNESSLEPRLAISNNDCSVKFFDIPIALKGTSTTPKIRPAGSVRFNVAVNHSSLSPDGTTLLSVGDSSKVFLHRIHGGAQLDFSPIATLTVPPPDRDLLFSSLAASFSTAFSRDGTKYAVASQEGVVCVWDVRSTKPLKVYQTDKATYNAHGVGNGLASGFLSDDPSEWTRGKSKAPGWSARNVKFGSGGGHGCGKEIMTFTEHTSLLHVIDARTFETEEIITVPSVAPPPSKPRSPQVPGVSSPRNSSSPRVVPRSRSTPSRGGTYVRPYQRPASNARALAASIVNPGSSSRHGREDPHQGYPYLSPYVALEDTFRIPSGVGSSGSSGSRAAGAGSGAGSGGSVGGTDQWRNGAWRNATWEDVGGGGGDGDGDGDGGIEEDLVVIPPLGDRQVEQDVRALLRGHGIRARMRRDGSAAADLDGESTRGRDRDRERDADADADRDRARDADAMDIADFDEEMGQDYEWDCISTHSSRDPSRVQSRSSSPVPSSIPFPHFPPFTPFSFAGGAAGAGIGSGMGAGMGAGTSSATNRWRVWPRVEVVENHDSEERGAWPSPISPMSPTSPLSPMNSYPVIPMEATNADLDIAGTCFDPSGGYVYAATTEGIMEWNVRGSEKRWWVDVGDEGLR
ncbi:hypothetical protein BDP27DRAFT_1372006 [Rhodocollybia butyracea]|uniref:DUF2415 domain-containing protein n=1 Tax=Rhodocollybia butyracea TaxID=206335 RepID=A0A9P5TX10_9AGAR|nr:hypothetical protein BDP27DRAFT_1372006 [Rhodocollybia butyracea]